jgi:hypothetical protein
MMSLFGPDIRQVQRAADAPQADLVALLGLSADTSSGKLQQAFTDLIGRIQARYGFPASVALEGPERELANIWSDLKPSVYIPEPGTLFSPALSLVSGRETTEFRKLKQAVEFLAPVDRELNAEIQKYKPLVGSGRIQLEPEESGRWHSCLVQSSEFEKGHSAYLSPAEQELVTKLRLSVEHGIPDHGPARRLGNTNLVWKQFDGHWEPCIEGSRYSHSSLLDLSTVYLRICRDRDRLPENDSSAAEQKRIIERVLAMKAHRITRHDLLAELAHEYPPPKAA